MDGQQLGKYQIEAEIGAGAFAQVYRASDTQLGRTVAIKVLYPQLLVDPTFVRRFYQEARTVAALHHPNIVTIFDVGNEAGRVFITMELAQASLATLISRRGGLSWRNTLALLGPICAALDYAHERNIIHRDLKPANILISAEGRPLLSDFGFARLVGGSSASTSVGRGIVGTPGYIAPEVWEGDVAAPAVDIYALGCIICEMITGKALFSGPTPIQAMRSHDRGPQFPAEWPRGVPARVDMVLSRALARAPADRFPNARSLFKALRDLDAPQASAPQPAGSAAPAASSGEQTTADDQRPASAVPRPPSPDTGAPAIGPTTPRRTNAAPVAPPPLTQQPSAAEPAPAPQPAPAGSGQRPTTAEGKRPPSTAPRPSSASSGQPTAVAADDQRPPSTVQRPPSAAPAAPGRRWPILVGLIALLALCGAASLLAQSLNFSRLPPAAAPTAAPSPGRTVVAVTPSPGTTEQLAADLPPVSGEIELLHYYREGDPRRESLLRRIDALRARFPEATISEEAVAVDDLNTVFLTRVAAGSSPDLVLTHSNMIGDWVQQDMLVDLDSFAKQLSGYTPSALAGLTVDGRAYGVPEGVVQAALFYNKSRLATAPATTDELLAALREGRSLALAQTTYHLYGWLGAFDGKIIDAGGLCVAGAAGGDRWLEFVRQLKESGARFDTDATVIDGLFTSGAADMTISGPWSLPAYREALGEQLGVAPIPGATSPASPMLTVEGYTVVAAGDNHEGAAALALHLASPELLNASRPLPFAPAHPGVRTDDADLDFFAASAADAAPIPSAPAFQNFWGPFGDALAMVLDGTRTPQDAIAHACDEMNRANGL